MSAVARDSPQMMGEAADTPRCPVLQRDWLGEGQHSLSDSAEMGRGGAGAPCGITTTVSGLLNTPTPFTC